MENGKIQRLEDLPLWQNRLELANAFPKELGSCYRKFMDFEYTGMMRLLAALEEMHLTPGEIKEVDDFISNIPYGDQLGPRWRQIKQQFRDANRFQAEELKRQLPLKLDVIRTLTQAKISMERSHAVQDRIEELSLEALKDYDFIKFNLDEE